MTRVNRSRQLPSSPNQCSVCSAEQPRMWMQGRRAVLTPLVPRKSCCGSYGATGRRTSRRARRSRACVRPMIDERWRRTLRSVSRQRPPRRGRRRRRDGAARSAAICRQQASSAAGAHQLSLTRGSSHAYETSTSRLTTRKIDRDDEREALDDHVVAALDRVVQRLAHAGEAEDRLGEHRAATAGCRPGGR